MSLNLFIRQSFTEASAREKEIVQGVLDLGKSIVVGGKPVDILTGDKAYSSDEFKQAMVAQLKGDFTPRSFRNYRLELLRRADAFIVIRTGLSESTSFEISYNIFSGLKIPTFFAIHESAPIKTTLLQNLEDLLDVEYAFFKKPGDLTNQMKSFLQRVETKKTKIG